MRERPTTKEERERLRKLCTLIPQGVWYAVHVTNRPTLANLCSSEPSKYGNDFTPVFSMVDANDPLIPWSIACADLVPQLLADFERLEKAIGHALSWLEGTYPECGPDAIDIQSAMRVLAAAWPGRNPRAQTLPTPDPNRIARLFQEDIKRAQELIANAPAKEVVISDLAKKEPRPFKLGDRLRNPVNGVVFEARKCHVDDKHAHRMWQHEDGTPLPEPEPDYECEVCSAQPGSPTLCESCLERRRTSKNWKGPRPKKRESEPQHPPACETCKDTHVMTLGGRAVLCTHCPVPCGKCRTDGVGPYCKTTPCPCDCHLGSRR